MQQFFYDEQIRRFLLQVTRVFSNFQVEYGYETDNPQKKALYRVPVRYGDATRQAQTIIQQNSANSLPSTPLMTFHVTNLNYARDRIQEPYFVEKQNVRQRYWDTESESYETTQGTKETARLGNMESKCFQHELDHLEGITFNKRISKLRWDMAKKKALN